MYEFLSLLHSRPACCCGGKVPTQAGVVSKHSGPCHWKMKTITGLHAIWIESLGEAKDVKQII